MSLMIRNIDASFMKDFRVGGGKIAQLKIEMLNITNRPNVRALQGNDTFAPGNSWIPKAPVGAPFHSVSKP